MTRDPPPRDPTAENDDETDQPDARSEPLEPYCSGPQPGGETDKTAHQTQASHPKAEHPKRIHYGRPCTDRNLLAALPRLLGGSPLHPRNLAGLSPSFGNHSISARPPGRLKTSPVRPRRKPTKRIGAP